jgi:hypothetical protein
MADSERTGPAATTETALPTTTVAQARAAFAAFLADPQEAARAASSFVRLADGIAGPRAPATERATVAQSFYERITCDETTGEERSADEKATALRGTLTAMRVTYRAVNASPAAARAHLEIEGFNPATDDLRALYATPEGSARAQHAGYLHRLNLEARDLYERGATLAGDTLVIPREANSTPDSADQIRLGTLAHAVQAFTPLIGLEAPEKAQEFVALGRDIAGRTADGDTRLIVFREFYRQVQRDDDGRLRTPAEQAAQLDIVLEQMRKLAGAMRGQEWTREPVEMVALEDWERVFEARQRSQEYEAGGRLGYLSGENAGPEFGAEREGREQDNARELDEERAIGSGFAASVSYERIALNQLPPRLPADLTQEQEERLRYEVLPALDRQIESGVRPRDIYRYLATQVTAATQRAQEREAAHLLTTRAPDANAASSPTRADEARALYTLQTLGVTGPETIAARNFTGAERAAALDAVGGRLAQDFRSQLSRLNEFAALEQERSQLTQQAAEFAATQRAAPEFQQLLAQSRTQNADARAATRQHLAGLLVNPEIASAQTENAARLDSARRFFHQTTGQEITNSDEARAALAPDLRRMRGALGQLAAERATLPIEKQPQPERYPNPLYAGAPQARGLRLAVENLNEYRTLARVAANTRAPVQFYPDRAAPALDGHSETRTQVAAFARDYVAYRLQDPDTRLRNSHRLFREFSERLEAARTPLELRQTIAEIRQENYARARQPEQFARESAETRQRGEQQRRPLNEGELRRLLLAPAPARYTPEMRALRLDYLTNARDKAARIRGLAEGEITPSPALQTLLSEFARTASDNPERQARNIRAFLGDYLNPPDNSRDRFSRHNLHELRLQLAPVERDYLFQTIERAKVEVQEQTRAHQPELTRQAGPEQTVARETKPPDLRQILSWRVAEYLLETVRADGPAALQDPARQPQRIAQITRLMADTLREEGYPQAAERSAARLEIVAGRIITGLPEKLLTRQRQPQLAARTAQLLAATPTPQELLSPEDKLHPEATPRMPPKERTALQPVLEPHSHPQGPAATITPQRPLPVAHTPPVKQFVR